MKITLLLLLSAIFLAACGAESAPAAAETETVEMVISSWRAAEDEQMNNLLADYKELAPNVSITFKPFNPPDYDSMLKLELESGTGPDLMFARSYAEGREFFDLGYFADCTDIEGLKENFTEASLQPWQARDGRVFAVPFAAVSQVIYYNKDIFAEHGLQVPQTWDEYIKVCDALLAAGVTPFANGAADEWDILECLALGMLPNYTGGAEEREKYESGEKPLNDENFISFYTDVQRMAKYLPVNFDEITYIGGQNMFVNGEAAMISDGSWSLMVYEASEFEWGMFAAPAKRAEDTAMVFHPDMGVTMNANTAYPEEAEAFLEWLCSYDGVKTASSNISAGYFPMIDESISLADPRANECFALNEGKVTDARFIWPELMNLYTPMNREIIALLKGSVTPETAAESVRIAGIETVGQ